ncbi:MAG: cytochrome-c oxidase, cbb3-type subunit III [Ponticaulis sp.]|nr:cytochrome-c oxidase, cbb3-type subunit III [Ponticaulis sp.]|tara:strand:+ start:25624 stop:26511 length:888 start_codon:yes stop_codon:yes gene_type:complete
MSDHDKDIDAATGVETTGHEWDGIKELNNPLPRWWLWIFYATIAWSVIYMIFMPAIPALPGMNATNTPGLSNHSDREVVAEQVSELRDARTAQGRQLVDASLDDILRDQSLRQFADAAGSSTFGDNCATCHGAGGQGFPGYPTLADDVWLWGGSLQEIEHTIKYGIRQDNEETRFSMMPAFGRDKLLEVGQIRAAAHYVRTLSGLEAPSHESEMGAEVFQKECSTCHGDDGTGNVEEGAPNLTDSEWLYGSDYNTVYETIYSARNSRMPAWGERYNDATIKALAVYVYSLSGGDS